jgi:hypothetical protein
VLLCDCILSSSQDWLKHLKAGGMPASPFTIALLLSLLKHHKLESTSQALLQVLARRRQ